MRDTGTTGGLRTGARAFALCALLGAGGPSTGCSGTTNGGPSPLVPLSVSGLVMDLGTGAGIAGAAVSGGGKSATTDSRGYFTLDGLTAGTVTVTVQKDGYAPAYATPRAGDKPESTFVAMKAQGKKQSYSPSAAKTLSQVTEAGPYAVTFAAGSLDTSDSSLTVSITPVDPTKERAVLPGTLTTGDSTLLFPVTFAEFTILDASGKRVQLKSGQSATVELPIPPALRKTYPLDSKIHCYAFDPATGVWNDFVDGTVRASTVDGTTPVLAAAIKHFSWYGGAPVGDKCQDVYGTVTSLVDGRPLGNARVEASPGGYTYTDADGNFTVVAEQGASVDYVAYQTGYDVDGSLTGIPGAKYIEFGQVNEKLAGQVTKPCNQGAPLAAVPPAGTLGGPDNRLQLKVGAVSKALYEATAIFQEGSVLVQLQQGLPGPDGKLMNPTAASGAKITITDGKNTANVPELASTGTYILSGGGALTIQKGATYVLSIDADGNGSIDGGGSASLVGDLAWVQPKMGDTLPSAGLVASWSDTGTLLGGAYSPLYLVTMSGQGGTTGVAQYVGSDRMFTPYDVLKGPGSALPAGSYSASLTAYSGFAGGATGSFTESRNITGVGLSGTAFSVGQGPSIQFTLQ